MYMQEYKRWMEAELEDFDLKAELQSIEGDEGAIEDRFAVSLKFGTAGLRGTLGAGTNRMNIWVVRQATQGIADWVKTQGGTQTVAISYDSRLKGWDFAKNAWFVAIYSWGDTGDEYRDAGAFVVCAGRGYNGSVGGEATLYASL